MPTPNLALTPIAAAQAQKHVTANEAFARIDAAHQLTVLDRDTPDPPAAPADGARYLLPANASGAWSGHDGQIAAWEEATQGWLFFTPLLGWRLWVADENRLLVRTALGWEPIGGAANQVEGGLLGVNATADAANRLAVASPGVLLSHEGADMRLTLNKAAGADTGSVLFQTGYSARAEFGLTGDDDWHVKTSADGASFNEALVADAASGHVTFPNGVSIGGSVAFPPGALPVGAGKVNILNTTIADGAVFTFDLPGISPYLMFLSQHLNCGIFLVRSTVSDHTSYVLPVAAHGALLVAGANGAYDGTSGEAGKVTVAVDGDGTAQRVHVENRSGVARTTSITFFG